jgi:hypothetical protein
MALDRVAVAEATQTPTDQPMAEPQMVSLMVIVIELLADGSKKMALDQRNHLSQALSFASALAWAAGDREPS